MNKLTFKTNSTELGKNFPMTELVRMVKSGEYDPVTEELTLEFSDLQIQKIAAAQLSLLKSDLQRTNGKTYNDPNYLSAYEFIQTPAFINVCMEYGLSFETAKYQAKWLKLRHSFEYELALTGAAEGDAQGDIAKDAKFAYELAGYLFEQRLVIKDFESIYIEGDLFWNKLSEQGVRSYPCKQMLLSLWSNNRDRANDFHEYSSNARCNVVNEQQSASTSSACNRFLN